MASYNKVILLGNLTRDPELQHTPKGTAACKFGLAVNRKYRTEQGEDREEVTFLDVQCWAKLAEVVAKHLKKGSQIHLEGRLKNEEWDDKTTGKKVQKLRVVMESCQFLGGKKQDGQQAAPTRQAPKVTASTSDGQQPDEDDVPF